MWRSFTCHYIIIVEELEREVRSEKRRRLEAEEECRRLKDILRRERRREKEEREKIEEWEKREEQERKGEYKEREERKKKEKEKMELKRQLEHEQRQERLEDDIRELKKRFSMEK